MRKMGKGDDVPTEKLFMREDEKLVEEDDISRKKLAQTKRRV